MVDFGHTGAHNIIEELQLRKPDIVGPKISTINFLALQAELPGLLKVAQDPSELTSNLSLFYEIILLIKFLGINMSGSFRFAQG